VNSGDDAGEWFPKRKVSECILKVCGSGTTPRTISTAVSIVLPS